MKIIKKKAAKINEIVKVLKSGGLVIMPTETVYGAFVDATNSQAVKKLTAYKARPFGKPYSIAVSDQKMAEKYVFLNNNAKNLYKNFLPGPLTIVSKGKGRVAPGVESEEGTLGIRIPDYPLVLKIIKKYGKPLTATSANASYKKRPYKIADILDNLSQKQKTLIDLIIDAGTLPKNEPSTVIDTTIDDPAVLRQGKIKFKGKTEILSRSEENTMNLAKEIWQKYEKYASKRAIIFALEGEMGTGKTIFTKGLARAMGIEEEVVSPTYDLLLEYRLPTANYRLTHIDTWRMVQPAEEIKNLRTKELITDKSVLAIEWADRVADEVRKYSDEAIVIWVKISFSSVTHKATQGKENERLISWGVL